MSATVADVNPKTLDNAKRQFVELYGSALVLNTYLKIAVVLLSLVALGLVFLNLRTAAHAAQMKPLVIRIDDVGRAEAVQYDATAYQPQAPELRYFLTQFVVKHFKRCCTRQAFGRNGAGRPSSRKSTSPCRTACRMNSFA